MNLAAPETHLANPFGFVPRVHTHHNHAHPFTSLASHNLLPRKARGGRGRGCHDVLSHSSTASACVASTSEHLQRAYPAFSMRWTVNTRCHSAWSSTLIPRSPARPQQARACSSPRSYKRRLPLTNVRLPADSELLAESLVALELLDIADSPEHHPAHLVAQLARMAQLERLDIHFRTALPNHAVEQTLPRRARHSDASSCSPSAAAARISRACSRASAPRVYRSSSSTFSHSSRSTCPPSSASSSRRRPPPPAELHFDAETACMLPDSRTTDRARPGGRTQYSCA